MALPVLDAGVLTVPFINHVIDAAATDKVSGYAKSPIGEMMDGYALAECWLNA
jgi:peptide/nickel transport system substrate-binding protein